MKTLSKTNKHARSFIHTALKAPAAISSGKTIYSPCVNKTSEKEKYEKEREKKTRRKRAASEIRHKQTFYAWTAREKAARADNRISRYIRHSSFLPLLSK